MYFDQYVFDKEAQAGLTVYLHEDKEEYHRISQRPFVLVIPGGGYDFCSEREAEPIALNYFAEGYHAGVLRYHVGEHRNFEASLNDAQAALEKIQALALKWKIDTEKIVVIGFSAGGQLAAALSTMGKNRPNYCILGYAPILQNFAEVMRIKAPNLNEQIDTKTPPTFLFATAEDETVPAENTLLYTRALEEKEVPFECHVFEKGRHGLSLATKWFGNRASMVDPHFGHWFDLSVEWLEKNWNSPILDDEDRVEPPHSILDYSVRTLMQNGDNQAFLLKAFPQLNDRSYFKIIRNFNLRQIATLVPFILTEDMLKQLSEQLVLV